MNGAAICEGDSGQEGTSVHHLYQWVSRQAFLAQDIRAEYMFVDNSSW
jgi:hypothetical protein